MTSASAAPASASPDHRTLKVLFAEVCDLPAAAREARLNELGATTDERDAVLRLLEIDERSTDGGASNSSTTTKPRVATPVAAMLATIARPAAPETNLTGQQIGVWTIGEKIGQGGMGAVYRAERNDGQFQQTVAIKFLKGRATSQAIARLAEERQTLAALEHPNIARLIDGGATADGAPYIVMDFVNGVNIAEYCQQNNADLHDIARLMVSVCEAVSYAHQSLRLHCDLKPANILIDAAKRPKLLDFGIAELIDADATDATPAFTPRYASPEQRAGAKLSTATDVFSLGRVFEELIEQIPPSSRTAAARRELNAIVAKACATQPSGRYASVGAMRADIERFLRHEPVAAVQGGVAYRTRKLVERRWAMSLALSALVIGSVLFTNSLVRERDRALRAEAKAESELARAIAAEDLARAERDRAQVSELRASEREQEALFARSEALADRDRARRAEANSQREAMRALRAEAQTQVEAANTRETRDFLFSLFNSIDPNRGGGPQMTAVDLLKKGRERVASLPADQRELKANLYQILGRIHENTGLLEDAKGLYVEAAALYADANLGNPIKHADVLGRMAILDHNRGYGASAEAPARESYAIRRARFAPDSAEMADAENTLGLILNGLNKQAESNALLTKSLATREKLFGEKNEEVASTLHNLGLHYARFGQPALAETMYRRSLAIKYEVFGRRHPKILNSLERLSALLGQQRRFAEAEAMASEAYQTRLQVHGPNSDHVANAANEWALILNDMGRYAEAEKMFMVAVNNPERSAPDAKGLRTLSYAVSLNNMATMYVEVGDLEAAEKAFRTALDVRRSRLPADDVSVARGEQNLGRTLTRMGKTREAEALLTRAYETRLAKLGAKHGETQDSIISRAERAAIDGEFETAQKWLALTDEAIVAQRPSRWLTKRRIESMLQSGPARLELLEKRVAYAREKLGERDISTLRTQLDYAEALAAAGNRETARQIANDVLPRLNEVLAPNAAERKRMAALPLGVNGRG
jgi:serine/threonine-protein kinase